MKLAIVLILLANLLTIAGPVCGQHVNTAEALACCEKGHKESDPANDAPDLHAKRCCAHCDLGKTNEFAFAGSSQYGPVKFSAMFVPLNDAPGAMPELQTLLSYRITLENNWTHQKLVSASPPPLYLSHSVFLI